MPRAAKFVALLLGLALSAAAAAQIRNLSGAGATFPYPLYAKWAQAYAKISGVQINYQAIGSGGGIKQIKAGTVDFGASDSPLPPDQLAQTGLVQFPTVVGGVVPVVNLPGIRPGQLQLSPALLADLFLGKIVTWDDPRIAELNPGVALPSTRVTVVHRADASGTTWIFTNYLAKVSPDWASRVGNEMAVSWPSGIGGKGNEGVASYVQRIAGAIGYVEFAYALQNKLNFTALQNHAGRFVQPSIRSFQNAAANADWESAPGLYVILTDQPGEDTWPIAGATFILLHRVSEQPQQTNAVVTFFDWAYANGDDMARELDYVPLPDNVIAIVHKLWSERLRGPNGEAVWPNSEQHR